MSTEPKPSAPAAPKPRGKYSAQDKKLANDLSLAEQTILAALGNAEAAPMLAEGSYTPEGLQAGLTLQKVAMQTYIARQEADAGQIVATRAFTTADKAARSAYAKLRGFGKSAFMKDAAGRAALGLGGVEPKDQQKFLTAATALIGEGKNEPYAAKLAKKSVTAAKLDDFAAKLDAWKEAAQMQTDAIEAVPEATTARDAAAKALFDWLAEYKQFARTQFKNQPAIAKRLLL